MTRPTGPRDAPVRKGGKYNILDPRRAVAWHRPKACIHERRSIRHLRSGKGYSATAINANDRFAPRSCHSMNAHFANRRALTPFWRYYAVLYEHCHRACVAHAIAELRIRQRLRLFGFGSQSRLFPSVLTRATKDRARSQEIVGRRARSSNLVAGVRYNARPTIAEALFSYRRAPVTPA